MQAEEYIQKPDQYGIDRTYIERVQDAVIAQDVDTVIALVLPLHRGDMAELVSVLNQDVRQSLIHMMGDMIDPQLLTEIEGEVRSDVVDALGAQSAAQAIASLETDDAVEVMEDLREDSREEILDASTDEVAKAVSESFAYPEDSAGRMMHKNFVTAPQDWDVGMTIDFLREEDAPLPRDFYSIFIIDEAGMPVGYALVSRIIRSPRHVMLADLMERDLISLPVHMDQEEVAYIFRKYSLSSAPVTDEQGGVVGVITIDDIVDIIEEESEEDIMRLGGVEKMDIYSAFTRTAMARFPWLFLNLLTAIAASAVIALFDGAIEKLVALAVLMPIVASMAGNAGTQTLTVAVRAIATKELAPANAWRVVRKEAMAAMLNAFAFALIVGLSAYIIYDSVMLSIIFSTAMIFSLLVAALCGATIPLLLVRMNIDPAVSSVVFLTTVTDISAFFIFLGLASMLL